MYIYIYTHTHRYIYIYIYVHTFSYTPTYHSSPPAGLPQDMLMYSALQRKKALRKTKLFTCACERCERCAGGAMEPWGKPGDSHERSGGFMVFFRAFIKPSCQSCLKIYVKHLGTPQTLSLLNNAKHIIAKVCGLNMIECQFWMVLAMQQLEFHWRNIWLPWTGHYCRVIETSHLYSCKVMPPSSLLVYKPI